MSNIACFRNIVVYGMLLPGISDLCYFLNFPLTFFFYFVHGSLQESCLYAAKFPTKFFVMFFASVYLGIQLFSARLIMFGMEVSKRNP